MGKDKDWNSFLAGIYADFGMLGWSKTEVDSADISLLTEILKLLTEILKKTRDEKNIDFDVNEAREAIKKHGKRK